LTLHGLDLANMLPIRDDIDWPFNVEPIACYPQRLVYRWQMFRKLHGRLTKPMI
jgi:hypothetical protein